MFSLGRLVFVTVRSAWFSKIIEEAIKLAMGTKPRHIPRRRPQANGLVEVFNRIFAATGAS